MVGKRIIGWLSELVLALQFLTRLPLPLQPEFTTAAAARSVTWYPLAGLAVGALLTLAAWLASALLPTLPAAVLVLIAWAALTGGLHLDGWMDTADGVLSHRSRERMLEIMRDSRVGAMGVIAGVLLLLFKLSLLASLLEPRFAGDALIWLGVIPLWSRWWMSVAVIGWPRARADGGMAGLLVEVKRWQLLPLTLLALLGSVCWLAAWMPLVPALLVSLAALAVAAVTGAAGAWWLTRKLGGLTGDTYGALNEGVEALLLAVAIAYLGG